MNIRKRLLAAAMTAAIALSSFGGVISADELPATTEATAETKDLSGYSFETVYGSQLYSFLEHQYTFQGEQIPVAESNFYFINAFFELTNYAYYGMYPQTSEGYVDLAAAYSDQSKYSTYGDFLIAYAERTLESSCIIAKRANDEHLVLSDETLADIETMLSKLRTEASSANMSLDEYLQLYYGPSCNENAYREVLKNYYLSDLYTSKYCEDHTTDDMLYVPNVCYALFYAPQEGSDEAAIQSAESLANDLVTAAGGDVDAFETLAQQSVTDGYCRESNTIAVSRGQTVPAFNEWCFDEARQFGDIEVIYAPEYGYFAVAYLGITMQDSSVIDSQIVKQLTQEISDAIESGQYQFGTDQAFQPAVLVPADGSPAVVTDPTGETVPGQDGGKSNVATVLIIIFAVIGGVAIIAIIIILTAYILKKINNNGSAADSGSGPKKKSKDRYNSKKKKESSEDEDGDDDIDEFAIPDDEDVEDEKSGEDEEDEEKEDKEEDEE